MLDLYHRRAEMRCQMLRDERVEHTVIQCSLTPDYQEDWVAGTLEVVGTLVVPIGPCRCVKVSLLSTYLR